MSDTDKQQETLPSEGDGSPVDEIEATDSAAAQEAADTAEEQEVADSVEAQEAADTAEEHEVADSAEEHEVAIEEKPIKRGSNAVAWLALLLSAVALAAVAYTISRDWLAASDTSALDAYESVNNRVTETTQSLSALDARVQDLDGRDSGVTEEIDALRRELDERVRLLSSLPARMTSIESSVASLAGVSAGTRDTWLLAEAEYYLQIANAQLQLANNPHLAAMALSMADERVVQMGNPALTDVRRAISDELAALEVMEKPDVEGATMTLASLARVVDSLPMRRAAETADEEETPDPDAGNVQRAWSSVKNAMSGLVKVTPPDQSNLALVTPDAEYFLRNNLALQLQTARLALLRGEQAVFEQTLDDSAALLSDYFDGDSAQVASAQETLSEIRGNVFTTSVPDISGSLQLLRQYRTLRENTQ